MRGIHYSQNICSKQLWHVETSVSRFGPIRTSCDSACLLAEVLRIMTSLYADVKFYQWNAGDFGNRRPHRVSAFSRQIGSPHEIGFQKWFQCTLSTPFQWRKIHGYLDGAEKMRALVEKMITWFSDVCSFFLVYWLAFDATWLILLETFVKASVQLIQLSSWNRFRATVESVIQFHLIGVSVVRDSVTWSFQLNFFLLYKSANWRETLSLTGSSAMRLASRPFILTLAAGMTFGFCFAYLLATVSYSGRLSVPSFSSLFGS